MPSLTTAFKWGLLGVAIAGSSFAEPPASEEKPPLLIEMSCDKASYKKGEKIVFEIKVTNQSGKPMPVLVRGCDWKDLEDMDKRFQQSPEKIRKQYGNVADRWRAEGLPYPLGVLELTQAQETAEEKAHSASFCGVGGCGTGLKNGTMPDGASCMLFVHVDSSQKKAGKYVASWKAYRPLKKRNLADPSKTLGASNEVKIEIVEVDTPPPVTEAR